MSGVNKALLVGRVGKQPEVRHLENGKSVASFSLATSETWKDQQGQKQESTEWHNVVFWGNVVKVIESYVNKGDLLYIEGKIKTKSYEKDGVTKYITEIVGDSLTMLGQNNSSQSPQSNQQSVPQVNTGGPTDDLPF